MNRFLLVISCVFTLAIMAVTGIAAGADDFKVKVVSSLPEDAAAKLQRALQADGYGPVELAVDAAGKYSVLVGPLASDAQAQALVKDLQVAGYQPEGVVSGAAVSEQKTVSRAEAGTVYRVQVSEFPEKGQADDLLKSLVSDDYAGVEVAQDGGGFKVYLGAFSTEGDAGKLHDQLRRDGYSLSKVVATRETSTVSSSQAARISETVVLPPEAMSLSQEDQQKVRDIATRREKANVGLLTADELIELRNEIKTLKNDMASVVKIVTSNEQDRREKQVKMRPIQQKFNQALIEKRFDVAEDFLKELQKVSPDDSSIVYYGQLLEKARASLSSGASAAEQVSDTQKKVVQLLGDARAAEAAKKPEEARVYYQAVLSVDPSNAEARSKISQLAESIRANQAAQLAGAGLTRSQKMLVYGGIGIVALMLATLSFVLYQNTRRERELIAQVHELATHSGEGATVSADTPAPVAPAKGKKEKPPKKGAKPLEPALESFQPALGTVPSALGGGSLLSDSLLGKAVAPVEEEEEKKPAPAPSMFQADLESGDTRHEARPPGEADVLFLGDVQTPTTPPPAEPVEADLRFEDLNIPLPEMDEPPPPKALEPPMPTPDVLDSVDLDELLKADVPGVTPAASTAPPVPSEVIDLSAGEEPKVSVVDIVPPVPAPDTIPLESPAELVLPPAAFEATTKLPAIDTATATPAVQQAAEPAPKSVAQSDGLFFEQTFDEDQVGTQPPGWQGEYDYATLTVDSSSPSPNSKACLKFEKRSGAGGANYTCRFPNASGRVIVEFDLRCDEKNKYLLGFYIEKDEDFKQSVHTIVHRTDSKSQPTLRIQGEPVPYDLGTWRHVKYDLNLLAGLVTAYIDSEEVVRDAKLPTNPAFINTLSIRDNLATTGILYLDNIKIYKG